MNLIRCPACGCSVQVADALLGRRVRCFGCGHRFQALADRPAPVPWPSEPASPPRPPEGPRADDEHGPFCPGCGRRIGWSDPGCPFCGEELEPEDSFKRRAEMIRRDLEPHRGPLILALGNLSMIVGGLSLCLVGFGALLSIPVGILAWAMANRDLARMREGRMDPRGKMHTEAGRAGAIAGIVLGLIFGAFFALVLLGK